jgi:lipid A ethanolaminephosphotransferase
MNILSPGPLLKPVLAILLVISSMTNYFMLSYGIIIDEFMIHNVLETNSSESMDLLSLSFVLHLFLLGLLPAFLLINLKREKRSWQKEAISSVKIFSVSLLLITVTLLTFNRYYTSFFREYKPLRYYANPAYGMYCMGRILTNYFSNPIPKERKIIGADAKTPEDDENRELVILVVGEAARWDHFSLNGYERQTNPTLEHEDILNFFQMYSCGTSTAISVPCMFSSYSRKEYSNSKAKSTQNLLDVLKTAGVEILWRDNNSDSKGVAECIPYQDYKTPENNTICDVECRDEGMLVGLDDFIKSIPHGDVFIVLHQMGNHGPAYYKRYPPGYDLFTPVCETNQLQDCSPQEIINAYDNAIVYTDFFLSKVISLLKEFDGPFETALFYISDHGESLGENGLYLHGMPYFMAPEAQKHVPAFLWLGEHFQIDKKTLYEKADNPYSQDNLFHTILGIFEIQTEVYDRNMDIIYGAQ